LLGERSRWALFDVSLQERSSALTKLWALARILLRSERPALTRSPRVTLDHNIKERWNGLAVFEHQPTFAANKRGTHLAGKMLHPVKDGFPFASLGELCSRVGEGDRNEL